MRAVTQEVDDGLPSRVSRCIRKVWDLDVLSVCQSSCRHHTLWTRRTHGSKLSPAAEADTQAGTRRAGWPSVAIGDHQPLTVC